MTDRFRPFAAVYLILVRDNKVLMIRRFNTGWSDGFYTVPAGHLDGNEPASAAMCREAQEEVGVTIDPADITFSHVVHRIARDTSGLEYVDFFLSAERWTGEPTNMEPNKSDDLQWFPLDALPEGIVPNVRAALDAIKAGASFSEFGW
jgi:8-oxo-dGTP diphosphatase